MRILLLGYGKMGKTIESIALERGHTIDFIVDKDDHQLFDRISGQNVDVAIEFSQPDAALENILKCFDRGIPVVSGTTGWLDQFEKVKNSCEEKGGTLFYASNYSLGVNIFFKVNQFLAKVMDKFPAYQVSMEEIHHTEKKDAPSGTAITLAEGIIQENKKIRKWVNRDTDAGEELGIKSKRINEVPGTHTVQYSSAVDDIEIKHTAHSRQGFALGAVLVAEWVIDRKGILGMDDFLNF
ncbi:4-hydroxy-tetrahydrodipicolinate reductase [Fulvivirgaceae bacterium BMA12]|uniref:4-hydroxy-tetrahydrodipicolinate reductase n=1 Tax=Agaribacillus aureus TaxID=3051825 RepID=A0ABT8L8P8_9BACT|nr:4-hydroxy-tetrahydrodipicolinate reductase [Fulvivirgaceae bacterium BMA12]